MIFIFSFCCRSSDVLAELQISIVAASFLKQPAFCCQLIQKYVELTNQLTSCTARSEDALVVTLFQHDEFDMKTIAPDCSFKTIKITSVQSQNKILLENVRLLTHAVMEFNGLETDLTTKCTLSILDALKYGTLRIKAKCLQYFSKLLKNILYLDRKLQPLLVWILECIESVQTSIPMWQHHKLIEPEDIEKYAKAVNEWFESSYIFKLFETEYLWQASSVCFKILHAHHSQKVAAYDKIVPTLFKFLKAVSNEIDNEKHEKLATETFELVKLTLGDNHSFKNYVELLGMVVSEQIKNFQMQSWCLVDDKITEIENTRNPRADTTIGHLECLRAIFITARSIEHNIMIHLQRKFCDKTLTEEEQLNFYQTLCQLTIKDQIRTDRRLFPRLDTLSAFFIKQFTSLLTTAFSPLVDTSTLLLFAEIAVGILSISDAQDIDDYIQSQLILIALCPFVRCSELLFNHFQQAFENAAPRINKIMETPFVRGDTSVCWEQSAFKTITTINFEFVSAKNKEIFIDFISQIVNSVKRHDCIDQIMKALISYVIQENMFSISELEKYMKSLSIDPDNHLVLSFYLRKFYCLTSGHSCIFQTAKDSTYSFTIVCQRCQNSSTSLTEPKQCFNLINQFKGKFVRAVKQSYKHDENYNKKYFEMFVSNDARVRSNMTKCLPSILYHLDLDGLHSSVDHLLNPIIDDQETVRTAVASCIHIFPQLENEYVRKKCLEKLFECTKKFLVKDNKADQSMAIHLIATFATSDQITEAMLLSCFRMTLFYCVSAKSMVSRQACLYASEMCFKFGISPKSLLIWYKTDLFKLIVSLNISNYCTYKIGLQKSLSAVSSIF